MSFKTVNPFTQKPIINYENTSDDVVLDLLKKADLAQVKGRFRSVIKLEEPLRNLAQLLLENKDEAACLMAEEMGKPISQGIAEIEKCADCCLYYAEHLLEFNVKKEITLSSGHFQIQKHGLGVVLGIMPWNYPFWQVIRFAIPTIIGGNTVLVKHAPSVYGCADMLEQLMHKAGFDAGIYSNIRLKTTAIATLISNPIVRGVSLTGSTRAGKSVGKLCGENLKPVVLELGGSNPFIVHKDAKLDIAIAAALLKMQNSGQSCIAPKRFIIHQEIKEAFLNGILSKLKALKPSNPMQINCEMGPLARLDLAEELEKQVKVSVKLGAKEVLPFKRENAQVWPCILDNVKPGMPAFDEELFGPVYAITTYNSFEEALDLANQSDFGLGASVFTEDKALQEKSFVLLNEGAVFINAVISSNVALPFGGVKQSGIGRELGEAGIASFQNLKTIKIA